MARNPKIRAHYSDDAAYLMRMAHAIELDKKRPKPWRQDIIADLQKLAAKLLQAPSPTAPEASESSNG